MATTTAPPSQQPGRMNWFDQQFSQIGWPMLIALTVLFTVLMWVFSGIGWLATRHPAAHRKAKIVFISSTVYLTACVVAVIALARHPELLR